MDLKKFSYTAALIFILAVTTLGPAAYAVTSVKLRVVAANPSAEKSQTIPIKIYLPQEATPKDIVDKGEMEIGYDSERSVYYVYKSEIVLTPKQVRVFEVELQDIWFVSDQKLKSIRNRTEHIIKHLEGTNYLEPAKFIVETIYARLGEIATSQADESLSKDLHIGLYRSNLKVMDDINADIAKLEKLLVAVGAAPAPEMLAESKLNLKSPSRATTWFIIFAILIFIGLLGAVFFFTWQAQLRASSHLSSKAEEGAFPELHLSEKANERMPSGNESGPRSS